MVTARSVSVSTVFIKLHSVWYLNTLKHAVFDRDQVTKSLKNTQFLYPLETLGLLLRFALVHYHFVLYCLVFTLQYKFP